MDKSSTPRFVRYTPELGRHPYEFNGLSETIDEVVLSLEADALRMGHEAFQARLEAGKGFDQETGLDYAVLHGSDPSESSTDRAIILHAALGISLEEMLPIAEFIRRISDKQQLMDASGKPLPVIVTGTPDFRFDRRLSPDDRQRMRNGDMRVVGRQNMRLVNRLMPRDEADGPLEAIMVGYSLGTANAVASAEVAPDFNVHVESLIMGATPNVVYRRGRGGLLASFVIEGARGSYPAGTPRVFTQPSASQTAFFASVVRSASFYYRNVLAGVSSLSAASGVLSGYRRNGRNTQVNVGNGTRDRIGPHGATQRMVDQLSPHLGEHLQGIAIEGATHSWSRNPRLLGAMVGYALGRTKAVASELL